MVGRVLVSLAAVALTWTSGAQVFRGGRDVIEIQVQVLGADGTPVSDLRSDEIEVKVAGRPRPIVDLAFVSFDQRASDRAARPDADSGSDAATPPSPPQTFVLALDAATFSASSSPGVSKAAAAFVRSLPSDARIGLFTYPIGPRMEPSLDHDAVAERLSQFSGQRVAVPGGRFNLRLSELVDYTQGNEAPTIARAHCSPADRPCLKQLDDEVWTTVEQYEAQARASLGMLRDLLVRMRSIPGRKILVLTSQGVPVADRPGGRPDAGDIALDVGSAAAEANTMIYCLYIDRTVLERYSAEQRASAKVLSHRERDSDVSLLSLSLIAGAAGGTVSKVLVGDGDVAYARIVRETSAAYVVHVDAIDRDRSGRPLEIEVKTTRPHTQVRSRKWVVVPRAN